MPGLISHFLCGAVVQEKLDERLSIQITRYNRIYNIGTQGPDVFFYYIPYLFKRKTNIGSVIHRKKAGEFIKNLIVYAGSLDDEKKIKAFVYIAGYLTHYSLDCHAHPYIYYKTGTSKKGKPSAIRHSLYHRRLETAIDSSLLMFLKNEKSSQRKLYTIITAKKEDAKLIGELLTYAVSKTYNISIGKKDAQSAIKYMQRATRLLQSKKGRRKKLIYALENHIVGYSLAASIIRKDISKNSKDCLNLNKQKWRLPWDAASEKNESFPDLFFAAAEESTSLIELLFAYMSDAVSIEQVLGPVGSRSFLSGLSENEDMEFVCFEKKHK